MPHLRLADAGCAVRTASVTRPADRPPGRRQPAMRHRTGLSEAVGARVRQWQGQPQEASWWLRRPPLRPVSRTCYTGAAAPSHGPCGGRTSAVHRQFSVQFPGQFGLDSWPIFSAFNRTFGVDSAHFSACYTGSYLGYLTSNRCPGHGCRIHGLGQYRSTRACNRCQLKRSRCDRRRSALSVSIRRRPPVPLG